jgi:hypothetical protein
MYNAIFVCSCGEKTTLAEDIKESFSLNFHVPKPEKTPEFNVMEIKCHRCGNVSLITVEDSNYPISVSACPSKDSLNVK